MVTFYAFCRIVDDVADERDHSVRDRRIQLGAWRRIVRGEQAPADEIAADLIRLPAVYGFDPALLEEIIDGVSMDLEQQRFPSFEDLRRYCYKVASVVGLVSLRIFGLPGGCGAEYAINLGLALQLTNILRDVRTDWENEGRLYLPLDDLAAHGVTEDDIASRRHTPEFRALMEFEGRRALEFYRVALDARPVDYLPQLQSAEAMRTIYHGILTKMRADGYRVFDRRYRLSNAHKALILAGAWFRSRGSTTSAPGQPSSLSPREPQGGQAPCLSPGDPNPDPSQPPQNAHGPRSGEGA